MEKLLIRQNKTMSIFKEYFKISVRNLRTRRLRSWLTILGIVVGVFLVITLISLSSGIQDSISKQLKSLGGDVIMVMPGSMDNPMMNFLGGQELSKEDLETLQKVKGVDLVLPMSYKAKIMHYKDKQKTIFLAGIPWDEGVSMLTEFQGWTLSAGDWPKPGKRELIIGSMVADKDFFGKRLRIGEEATIAGRTFKVAGILNSSGSKTDDTAVYLDQKVYQQITGDRKGGAQIAMLKIKEGASSDNVVKKIKESLTLVRKRKQGEDASNFTVIDSEKMGGIVGGIMGVIKLSVMVFAGIAILVGGLGIMNTMFTAVQERTKEIGVLKAIGATNAAVIIIFLIESSILGLIGGLGGIVLGLVIAKFIELYGQVHPMFYFEAYMSFSLIVFSLLFSLLIGGLSGYLPARRAARLNPTEALRSNE